MNNVRPASAPPGTVANERRQCCILPAARPARLDVFVSLLTLTNSANLVDNWSGKSVAICEALFEKCPVLGRQPSPATIKRWLLAEAAPHKMDNGKYNVEDREDGTTGNAERSELADEYSRLLRKFMEQLNRHATEAALGQEAASAAAAAREELHGRERTYLGDVMTDFEATFYRGNRNRVRDDIAEEGDYDEEQEDEEHERETGPRQRRRSSALKRAHWASVGQNSGAPPSIPSVGGANDPFLADILEQARVRDAALAEQQQRQNAAMAEQQQRQTAAFVAALAPRQRGGSATALLQELRSIDELRATGAIDDETAGKLRVKARADFL